MVILNYLIRNYKQDGGKKRARPKLPKALLGSLTKIDICPRRSLQSRSPSWVSINIIPSFKFYIFNNDIEFSKLKFE